jgi:hypothetical protein
MPTSDGRSSHEVGEGEDSQNAHEPGDDDPAAETQAELRGHRAQHRDQGETPQSNQARGGMLALQTHQEAQEHGKAQLFEQERSLGHRRTDPDFSFSCAKGSGFKI